MIDLNEIRAQLRPPVTRATLCNFIARGVNMPGNVKALAYVALQGMRQAELDGLAIMADQALTYFEHGDFDGLARFLAENKVPPLFVEFMRRYAPDLATE